MGNGVNKLEKHVKFTGNGQVTAASFKTAVKLVKINVCLLTRRRWLLKHGAWTAC